MLGGLAVKGRDAGGRPVLTTGGQLPVRAARYRTGRYFTSERPDLAFESGVGLPREGATMAGKVSRRDFIKATGPGALALISYGCINPTSEHY